MADTGTIYCRPYTLEEQVADDPFVMADMFGIRYPDYIIASDDLAEEIVDWQSNDETRCRGCHVKEVEAELKADPIATVYSHYYMGVMEAVCERGLLEVDYGALTELIEDSIRERYPN